MEYKHLIDVLDAAVEKKERLQSASKKNRPESSSPDKIKQRNPKDFKSDSEDNYSDEEIVNEDDDGDDYGDLKEFDNIQKNAVDIENMAKQDNDEDKYEEENYEDALRLAELMATLNTLGKPTIARVNGHAFGGAVGLVACCDIVIAAPRARFCLSEVRLGLVPAVISPYVIEARGARNARRFFLTAEQMSARKARRVGLVHEVAKAGKLDRAVEDQIEALGANVLNITTDTSKI